MLEKNAAARGGSAVLFVVRMRRKCSFPISLFPSSLWDCNLQIILNGINRDVKVALGSAWQAPTALAQVPSIRNQQRAL